MTSHLIVEPAENARHWAAASLLLAGYVEWLDANVDEPLPPSVRAALAADVRQPSAAFAPPNRLFLAWQGRLPVGVLGAAMRDDHVELTRFYVRPVARGSGTADRLLATVLDALDAGGHPAVQLDTLPAAMPAAHRLYQRHGFVAAGPSPLCPTAVRMCRQQARVRPTRAVPA